jgi:hypothetical protein
MRTTLDIDEDVLQAAKELARAEGKTAGRVLSDLARTALTSASDEGCGPSGPCGAVLKNGWYVLPRRGGGIVTNELIDRLLEEADLEDAGLVPKR